MSEPKPPVRVSLEWTGECVFRGRVGDTALTLDGDGVAGLSPMQALASAFAGCMAMDVASILTKGRHPLNALTAGLTAHRAAGQPPRFTRMELHYVVTGDVPATAIDRALQLSREKYCSVWHSLREDIELTVSYDIHRG